MIGMYDLEEMCGYVVLRFKTDMSNEGTKLRRVRMWLVFPLRLSAPWQATRILSSPPSFRRDASSAICVRRSSLSCFERAPSSMTWVSCWIFMVIDAMEEERTASSSRRSAKLRDRSRGRVSRVWVYSETRERVYTVLMLLGCCDLGAREGTMVEFAPDDFERRGGQPPMADFAGPDHVHYLHNYLFHSYLSIGDLTCGSSDLLLEREIGEKKTIDDTVGVAVLSRQKYGNTGECRMQA